MRSITRVLLLDSVAVTMAPELVEGMSVATVTVPQEAANSQVGFHSTVASLTDGT